MKKFFIICSCAVLAYFFYSCSCNCSKENVIEIPEMIIRKANEYVISKTGKDFFEKYISIDLAQTKFINPSYEMRFNFRIPEKPFVNSKIKFSVDSLGNVVELREIVGIPNCIEDATACEFNIDENQAREIAIKQKLEKGIRDWKVGFLWNEKYKKYVWHILSTLSESKGSEGYRGSGKELIINSFNGEIIEFNDWNIR